MMQKKVAHQILDEKFLGGKWLFFEKNQTT